MNESELSELVSKDPLKIAEDHLQQTGDLPEDDPRNWAARLRRGKEEEEGKLVVEVIQGPKPKMKYQRREPGRVVVRREK